jgi:hypothetical protein
MLLLCSYAGTSQVSVSVDPGTFVLNGNPTQSDISYHILVTNTSNQSASIFWSKRMSNNPAGWFSWICDKNLCYTPEISSCPASKPNVLGPGDSFEIQVHMNPASTEGSADYELNILDEVGNNLANVSGEIVINNTTAVKDVNLSKLTVYPNPTTEFFKVTEIPGLKDIQLYNIVGNKVRTFDAAPQKQYYVGDLTDGIYLVRLESASGKVIKTIRLSKR